jgi:phage tail protein X
LRASNAKLKASAAKPPAPVVMREPDPADVKLAASFHSYAQFKQELTGFFADLEKLRAENTALSADLREVAASSKEAKAALVKLERELDAEKDAHVQAEQTVTKLREQLRAVADAVAAAGLSFDKAPSGAAPTARLETSRARLKAAATTRQHTVKDGDTLETLADRYYGDATKWKLILDANRGRLPLDGAMPAGLELDIPAK